MRETINNDRLIDEFINNVFCRNHSNQIKAKHLWIKIKPLFTQDATNSFNTEWCHYINGTLDYEGMKMSINELKAGKKL